MVFGVQDGSISQQVRDAVLWELWQPAGGEEEFEKCKKAMHAKNKDVLCELLQDHVNNQLEELKSLRQKIDVLVEGPNVALIRAHNELLTNVFAKVLGNLNAMEERNDAEEREGQT